MACAGFAAGCAPKDAPRDPHAPALEMRDVRFYRHADELGVFRVSKTTYCLVVDPAQMGAFGGFGQVRVVPQSVDFKRGKKLVPGGYCPSP